MNPAAVGLLAALLLRPVPAVTQEPKPDDKKGQDDIGLPTDFRTHPAEERRRTNARLERKAIIADTEKRRGQVTLPI
jgi:hypothetical protein